MTAGPQDERLWRYQDVTCRRCGAAVLVVKFSPPHTSVQWTPEAVLACAEFTAKRQSDDGTASIPTCASLRSSIDAAIADGRIAIQPP